MTPLDLVNLKPLMDLTSGRRDVAIGLIDGPIARDLPEFAGASILELPGRILAKCTDNEDHACRHGTFVAGILCAMRGSMAPAICPVCTLLVRPIYAEKAPGSRGGQLPSARPEDVAAAIVECVEAGARILNLSSGLAEPSTRAQRNLEEALDYAAKHGVITVAASGNQGEIGSSAITRHPWVIPVVARDLRGSPVGSSNLGRSIGRRGLSAPGDDIISVGTDGKPSLSGGTSVATPFVTGAIALLWSLFPAETAIRVKSAVLSAGAPRRATIVPHFLDAWGAYHLLAKGLS